MRLYWRSYWRLYWKSTILSEPFWFTAVNQMVQKVLLISNTISIRSAQIYRKTTTTRLYRRSCELLDPERHRNCYLGSVHYLPSIDFASRFDISLYISL